MPRLQIPSAVSPQGALSGAVQAPAAQLAQTGSGAVWGAVAGLGQNVREAAQLVYAYEKKLKDSEDKAEMVRLQNKWDLEAEDTQAGIRQMKSDPEQGYRPMFDLYAERERIWKEELDGNQILSKDAKKEMSLYYANFTTRQQLAVKKFVNDKRVADIGAKLYGAMEQAMLAGNEKKAREMLNLLRDTGAIDEMKWEQKSLQLSAEIDIKQASKIIDERPLDALDILNQRDDSGAPLFFKNLPESTRRALMSNAKVARNEAQVGYYNDLLGKKVSGKASYEDFERAHASGLINKSQLLQQMKIIEGTATYNYDSKVALDIQRRIENIKDAGDVAEIEKMLATGDFSPKMTALWWNQVQSVYAKLPGSGRGVVGADDKLPEAVKETLKQVAKIFESRRKAIPGDDPASRAKRVELGDREVDTIEEMKKNWNETGDMQKMRQLRDTLIERDAIKTLIDAAVSERIEPSAEERPNWVQAFSQAKGNPEAEAMVISEYAEWIKKRARR